MRIKKSNNIKTGIFSIILIPDVADTQERNLHLTYYSQIDTKTQS